jgi:hypothetical protein
MVKLLVYGYALGVTSARKLEQKTTEDVAFACCPATSIPTTTASRRFARGIWAISGHCLRGARALSESGKNVRAGFLPWR